ncbi:MAG: hypothetical protein O2854_00105 [Chloroflexi bacterium]|nr:hypothetical protein [Chloroflexota bacterium]
MIKLTANGGMRLLAHVNSGNFGKGVIMRVSGTHGSLSLAPDSPKDTDRVIVHRSVPVLVVDNELEKTLPETYVDVINTAEGPKFGFTEGKPLTE